MVWFIFSVPDGINPKTGTWQRARMQRMLHVIGTNIPRGDFVCLGFFLQSSPLMYGCVVSLKFHARVQCRFWMRLESCCYRSFAPKKSVMARCTWRLSGTQSSWCFCLFPWGPFPWKLPTYSSEAKWIFCPVHAWILVDQTFAIIWQSMSTPTHTRKGKTNIDHSRYPLVI